jgi:hypothetical protein
MLLTRSNRFSSVTFGAGLFMVMLTGCMRWQPDWPTVDPAAPLPDVEALLQTADDLAAVADNREGLQASMDAYGRVLALDPYHVRALTDMANRTILMGAAYGDSRQAKRDHFRSAMRLCERAMYTNPDFKMRVDQGVPPWEASQVLGEKDMPAMMFWSTAVLYLFKECMNLPQKVINVAWIEHMGLFLAQMTAIDPEWGGGAIQFSQSLYFGILPAVKGGDAERSQHYLAQAVAVGSPWMLSRWGRAKYFHVRNQDRQGFEADLRWVLQQEVDAPGEAYSWRVYFRQDAQNLLDDADRYF